ncbi:MAG: hypothetical protein Q9191_001181 [Dirinaria sp. TL-2023a]
MNKVGEAAGAISYAATRALMAPIAISENSESLVANGAAEQNGEPPVSTLAAQLVNNLTRPKQQSRHQDREDFEQLLQVFDAESQDQGHVDPLVAREESIKLIDVVIKAGLDVLLRGSPFEDSRVPCERAIRSLKVIEVTLTRCPAVLYANDEGEPSVHFTGPIYLWLIPRLVNIAFQEVGQELYAAIASCLATIVSLERTIRSRSARLRPIYRYVQGCITGA